jgi:hypothetical protein
MSAPGDDEGRVSLDGLTPEEALRALLAVKPHGNDELPGEDVEPESSDG